MKRFLLPRLGDFIFVCVLVGCLLLGQRMVNVDADLGRHLTLGRYMLDVGRVPTRDILSFTRAGEPRPPYEWGSQVVFALAERAIGLDGVVLSIAGVVATAFLVVFIDSRQRGAGALVALALTVWAAAASSLHWLARPHVFTLLFTAVWLLLLDRLRRGHQGATWQLPAVMLLWANFHAGFIFGFIAWAAYTLGWIFERVQPGSQTGIGGRLLLVGAASLAASLFTPGPFGNWAAVPGNSSLYVLSRTAETLPISLTMPGTWPFVSLVLLALFLGNRRRGAVVAAHAMLLLFSGVLAIAFMRNIPLFCLAAVPILATWERGVLQRHTGFGRFEARMTRIDSSLQGGFWPVLAMLAAAAVLLGRGTGTRGDIYRFDPRRLPINAVDWTAKHELNGGAFNDLNWGGYILYRMWPEERVFIDSQSDFYGEPFIREYAEIYAASGDWTSNLDRFGISSVILPPGVPLTAQLMRDPAWVIAYQDPTAVVLVRRGAGN